MHAVWSALRDAVTRESRAALVTVLAVDGSAPREAGARMIVTEQGLRGTIGGGALEHRVWQDALQLLRVDNPQTQLQLSVLGPDLGQCCGGRVLLGLEVFAAQDSAMLADFAGRETHGFSARAIFGEGPRAERHVLPDNPVEDGIAQVGDGVFVERFCDTRTRLHLFGAGHVGKALVMALAPLPFRVIWHDERASAFPSLVPANVETRQLDRPEAVAFSADDFLLIMTHSHPLDLALVAAALRSPARFVGLIGSATKKARFLSRLRAAGFAPDALHRLACPIGVPGIGGKEPAVIAASVAAQLLAARESAALAETETRPHHARVAMGAR